MFLVNVTPVAEWILREEMQAQICKLVSASSFLPILSVQIEYSKSSRDF